MFIYDVLSGKFMKINFLMTLLIIIISDTLEIVYFRMKKVCLTRDILFQYLAEPKEDKMLVLVF